MSESAHQRAAAIYTRLSKKKGRSVQEQEAENRAECQRNGWPVSEVYTDTISASRFARTPRPDWGRLIGDLEAGTFGVLVLWESSRGDREPGSWLGLLSRCRTRRVLVHVTSHGRTYDMANPRDWKSLAEDGIDSAYESEKTSLRLKRAMEGNAVQGRPHGIVIYGYERVYDPHTRKLVKELPHKDQAPVVTEIIRKVASLVPVSMIARDLMARGIPAPRGGGRWDRATIRKIARNPAYIGKRAWKGQLYDSDVTPPLIGEDTYWAAVNVLSDAGRTTTRPGSHIYLLSYFATCAECGEMLAMFLPTARRPRPMYGCSGRGCAYIRSDWLDAYVKGRVVGLMSDPEFVARLTGGSDAEVVAARAQAAELRQRLDVHADQAAAGEISARSLARIEAKLGPAIKAAEERALRATVPVVVRDYVSGVNLIKDLWEREQMSVHTRRELVRTCFESIRLLKATRRGAAAGFDPDRVEITERKGNTF